MKKCIALCLLHKQPVHWIDDSQQDANLDIFLINIGHFIKFSFIYAAAATEPLYFTLKNMHRGDFQAYFMHFK